MLFELNVCFNIFSKVQVTEWSPIGGIAAHSAYDMFSWYKYQSVIKFSFSHLSVCGVGISF